MDWVREDKRAKRYENVEDVGLSDEERAAMFKRFERPLPRALEYLASLPDYFPRPFETLPQVPFKGDPCDVRKGGMHKPCGQKTLNNTSQNMVDKG